MVTQSLGVDIGCISKMIEGQGRGDTQVKDLKSMVLNGSSIHGHWNRPLKPSWRWRWRLWSNYPSLLWMNRIGEEKTARKGGISEWHVHKRRGKVIVAYNKVNRATDLLPYPEEPQMQNNTQLPFEKSAVLKRKPGRVEGRLWEQVVEIQEWRSSSGGFNRRTQEGEGATRSLLRTRKLRTPQS